MRLTDVVGLLRQEPYSGAIAARALLMPADPNKDEKYRISAFLAWLRDAGLCWYEVDLAAYRDHMLQERGLAPATASAHLATVRVRYRALLRSNQVRDLFYELARQELGQLGQALTLANLKATVDELLTRLENALAPSASRVCTKTVQDRADSAHLRLTAEQASALIAAPGNRTLQALRDTAILALMLCTGIRVGELVNLVVEDLRQRLGGVLALHVREGKGCKERLIPYGELEWCLAVVDRWLQAAGIDEGPVFRGFCRDGCTLLPGALTTRAIQYIFDAHPIMVDGRLTCVATLDLRRTYARRLYEAGFDLASIQQNLGHAGIETTLGYIGEMSAERRQPPAMYVFAWQGWLREGMAPLES